jgi:hypothetical protein
MFINIEMLGQTAANLRFETLEFLIAFETDYT